MRKLRLSAEELKVESFDPAVARDVHKGTVHANDTDGYGEACWEQPTNDQRLRQCYTPYFECDTVRWTCDFRCQGETYVSTES